MKVLPSLLSMLGLMVSTPAVQAAGPEPLPTVPYVDLTRYAGLWYEIASIPVLAQRGCTNTTATYTLRDDGKVDVVNACNSFFFRGPERIAKAVARVDDPQTNAKLKVQFEGSPAEGNYWVVDLDPNYQWAVVGEPSTTFVWILSRTPTLDPALTEELIAEIEGWGYDIERLNMTPQKP